MKTEVLRANTASEKKNALAVSRAGEILRAGGLVAIPTETVYGLAANALDAQAVEKIFTAKGRPQDNPLIVHISDLSQLSMLVKRVPQQAKALAKAFWPGPLTIILPRSSLVPDIVSAGLPTVAVRFPSDPIAKAIIDAAGVPLAAPSANLSGKPSPTTFARVEEDMLGRIDAIVDGGDCSVGVESTVVSLVCSPPRVLRPGGVTVEMLRDVLFRVDVDEAVVHQLKKGAVAASPGMKYKHYAPKAEVYLLDGTAEQYAAYVNDHAATGVAAMCYTGEEPALRVPCIACGADGDYAQQARLLFEVLRRCDDELQAKVVYAHCPSRSGMGLAVFNRLIRSAAFRVIPVYPAVIGLTGLTGAGKSAVCALLAQQGCAVIDCDEVTHRVLTRSRVIVQLRQAFGEDILTQDGRIDRKKLGKKCFSTQGGTVLLNSITHPPILRELKRLLAGYKKQCLPAVIVDAPTLFESGADALCEQVATVLADSELRCRRIMARDGIDEYSARLRMNAQKPDDFYIARSQFVLYNNEEGTQALQQGVCQLLQSLENRREKL